MHERPGPRSIGRREFLRRAAASGLALAGAPAILAACTRGEPARLGPVSEGLHRRGAHTAGIEAPVAAGVLVLGFTAGRAHAGYSYRCSGAWRARKAHRAGDRAEGAAKANFLCGNLAEIW